MALILDPNTPSSAVGPATGPAGGDLIKESDANGFVADVIEASMQVPVIVDFWAPWCEPCKQLGPALEKLVRNAGGLVRLVKVNIDENRELAVQMNVQSIPAVFGFRDGRPVDGFAGAVPESQLKSFLDRLTDGAKPPVEMALKAAKEALDAGDLTTASRHYGEVLAEDSAHPGAIAGMIRCFLAGGNAAQAQQTIDQLPPEITKHPEVAAAISAVELSQQGGDTADTQPLRDRLDANADDHEARFDLAVALYGNGQPEEAIEHLVELVRRDREWNEEAARKQLVKIFEALGPTDPLTAGGRRQLSSVLFS